MRLNREIGHFHISNRRKVNNLFSFRKTLFNINRDQDYLLNTENDTTRPCSTKRSGTNIIKKTDHLKIDFEAEVKEEIGKLESQMKIGWTTMTQIAEKVRARKSKYSEDEKLKNMKFSKEIFEPRFLI